MSITLKLRKILYIGISNLPLSLNLLKGNKIYGDIKKILLELLSNYKADLVIHSPIYLGSLDLIGSPTLFIESISKGITAFTNQLREGNSNILYNIASGSGRLLYYFSQGVLSSINAISSTVSSNLSISERERSYSDSLDDDDSYSIFSYITAPISGLFDVISNTTSYIMLRAGMTNILGLNDYNPFDIYYLSISKFKDIDLSENSYLFRCKVLNENYNEIYFIFNNKLSTLIEYKEDKIIKIHSIPSNDLIINDDNIIINNLSIVLDKDNIKIIKFEIKQDQFI